MKKILYIAFLGCLTLSVWSCESWLDVKPKQMTEEEELFSRQDGFKEALIGAYIRASKQDLYGRKLSFDYLDILAQRYNYIDGTGENIYQNPNYYLFSNTNTYTSPHTTAIWSDMYEVIANLNNLLSWIEKNRSVLTTPGYYEIIKAEALGLRSYIYFDLLRLYGPIYKDNTSMKCLPYRTEFKRDVKELETASAMIGHIISDLEEAHTLIKDYDTLDFDHSKIFAGSGEDGFLIARYQRMNYLAIKALLARAYLYQGNASQAKAYAMEVINSGKPALARSNTTNRVLSSEWIFAVYLSQTPYTKDVKETIEINSATYVINGQAFFQTLLSGEGENDWRVSSPNGFAATGSVYKFQKYLGTENKYSIPLIRLSEMYYIVAECEADLAVASTYLNAVRDSRGLTLVNLLNEDDRLMYLEREYRKEFYGEGQLWYFYKRHGYETFPNCPLPALTSANYIFPIPEDELSFGGITQ